jgi:hypothetical protein
MAIECLSILSPMAMWVGLDLQPISVASRVSDCKQNSQSSNHHFPDAYNCANIELFDSGSIRSIGFRETDTMNDRIDCNYHLHCPSDRIVELRFSYFDIASNSSMTLIDGNNHTMYVLFCLNDSSKMMQYLDSDINSINTSIIVWVDKWPYDSMAMQWVYGRPILIVSPVCSSDYFLQYITFYQIRYVSNNRPNLKHAQKHR